MGEEGTTAGLEASIETNEEVDVEAEEGRKASELLTEDEMPGAGEGRKNDAAPPFSAEGLKAEEDIAASSVFDAEVEKELDGVMSEGALNFARETLASATVRTRSII